MGIGFDTVGYVFLCFVVLPTLILKPHLIVYPLIVMTMFSFFFATPISLGSINVYPQDLLLFFYCCCAGCVVFRRFIARKRIFNVPDDAKTIMFFVLLYIMLHVAYMFVGLYQGVPPDNIVRRFITYSGCLYFFFPLLFLRDKDQFKKLLIFIVIIAVLTPVWQIYIFVISAEWQRAITSSGTVRLGIGGIPIIACAIFTILVFKKELKYYVLSVSPILAMILVGHRSVLLALGVSLILFFMWTKEVTKSLLFVYIGGFSLLLAFFALEMFTGHSFVEDAITRGGDTFNSENPTTVGRIYAIKNNFFIFKKKPIAGIGYNHEILTALLSSSILMRSDGDHLSIAEHNVLAPHNFVMRLLSHTGIIGTFINFAIIYLVLRRCYMFIRIGGMLRKYGVLLFCSITFFLIMALMNTTFVTEGWVFWFLCGASVHFNENGGHLFSGKPIMDISS